MQSHMIRKLWEAGWFFYLSDDTDTPIWMLSNNYLFISQNIKNLASVIILTGRSNRSDRLISVTVIDRSWPVMTGPCPSLNTLRQIAILWKHSSFAFVYKIWLWLDALILYALRKKVQWSTSLPGIQAKILILIVCGA